MIIFFIMCRNNFYNVYKKTNIIRHYEEYVIDPPKSGSKFMR